MTKQAETTNTAAETPAAAAPKKSEIARVIFGEMYGKSPRKDVIARFKAEAGLSEAGAATYYQNFVKAAKEAGAEPARVVAATEIEAAGQQEESAPVAEQAEETVAEAAGEVQAEPTQEAV